MKLFDSLSDHLKSLTLRMSGFYNVRKRPLNDIIYNYEEMLVFFLLKLKILGGSEETKLKLQI